MIGRFRANLVIGGGVPFEEDNWNSIEIGDTKFVVCNTLGRYKF